MKAVRDRTTGMACALLVFGWVYGCDDQSSETNQSQDQAPASQQGQALGNQQGQTSGQPAENSDAWTFSVPPTAATGLGQRLPASPELTAMVPATGLFPGATPVTPDIPNPYDGDAQAVAAGERHFAAFNCAGCHAPIGGGGMGPPLSDDDWIHGDAPAQIFLSIVHGRAEGMPAWGAMLPRKTVWELVTYVQSLSEIQQPAQRLGFPARGPRGKAPSQGDGAQASE